MFLFVFYFEINLYLIVRFIYSLTGSWEKNTYFIKGVISANDEKRNVKKVQ